MATDGHRWKDRRATDSTDTDGKDRRATDSTDGHRGEGPQSHRFHRWTQMEGPPGGGELANSATKPQFDRPLFASSAEAIARPDKHQDQKRGAQSKFFFL
jgi:hypothetical protein